MERKLIACAVASLFAAPLPTLANPTGASVAAGSASVAASGNTLTVTASDRSIINWQSFNIAAGETTNFVQPSASSISLNRVTGSSEASSIFGALNANGQLFLINPNGVLFGAGSQVNVGSLVASTLDISDANFLAGHYQFNNGGSSGALISDGSIRADDYVALFAPTVYNSGSITVQNGDVFIATGNGVHLTSKRGWSGANITEPNADGSHENSGSISAGGSIIIKPVFLNIPIPSTKIYDSSTLPGATITAMPFGGDPVTTLLVGTAPVANTVSGGTLVNVGNVSNYSLSGATTSSGAVAVSGPTTTGSVTLSIPNAGSVTITGAATLSTGGCTIRSASICETAVVAPSAISASVQPVAQTATRPLTVMSVPTPARAAASHAVPANAPLTAPPALAPTPPHAAPPATGRLALNLQKRDPGF